MSQASSHPAVNEQQLSQQLQHLSPFQDPVQPTASPMKGMDFNIIPHYLAETNPYFEKMLQSLLSTASIQHLNELRHIAILMHKIKLIELVRSLWKIYHQSGTGRLSTPFPIDPSDAKIWPEEVRSLALSQTESWNLHLYEEDPCLSYVDQQLHQLLIQIIDSEQELRMKQESLLCFTSTIEVHLEKIVNNGLQYQQMEIALHKDMVEYDFVDTLLKRKYASLEFNPEQKKLGQRLLKLKFQAIKTQYECDLIQEKSKAYLCTSSFPNTTQGQQLDWLQDQSMDSYQRVANAAREQMMALYVECAERQMRQAAMDFDHLWEQCVNIDQRISMEHRLTSTMLEILDQRFHLIHAKIARHFRFKTELFRYHQKNHTLTF